VSSTGAFSVIDMVSLGATLSVRGFAKLGRSMAVLDMANLGSSLSLRCCARMGKSIEAFAKLRFKYPGSSHAYAAEFQATSEKKLEVKMGGAGATVAKSITFTNTGGSLHGLWLSDQVIATSSTKFKTGVANLEDYAGGERTEECRTVSCHWQRSSTRRPGPGSRSGGTAPTRTLSPLLKELRPVAYKYKEDNSQVRFGFVAEELEKLLPEVVRKFDHEGQTSKGVVYQDFIALLTAALREHQGRIEVMEDKGFGNAEKGVDGELLQVTEALSRVSEELKATKKKVATSEAQLSEVLKQMGEKAQRKAANEDDVEFQTAKNDLDRQANDLRVKYGAVENRDGEAGTKELEQRLLRQDIAIVTIRQKLLECGCGNSC